MREPRAGSTARRSRRRTRLEPDRITGCRPATRTGQFSSTTSRPRSARASARSCSRRSCSCSARTPTSPCSGSRAASCGRRARPSATISRCRSTPRPRRASGARSVRKDPSGGEVSGVPAARTRIRAIGSRKRIVPSAPGRRRIPRRSAIATSRATSRASASHGPISPPVRRVVIVHGATSRRAAIDPLATVARLIRDRAEVGGAESRRIDRVRRARANRGTRRPRARHRAIGRGRPSRRARARSGSRGSRRRQVTRRAAIVRLATVARLTRDRAEVGGATSRLVLLLAVIVPGEINRRAAHRLVIVRGVTSHRAVRREAIDRGAANPRVVRREGIVPGAANHPAVRRAVIGRGETSPPAARPEAIDRGAANPRVARLAAIVHGAGSRAIRIASRSRRAVRVRSETVLPVSGATTMTDATARC